MSLYFDKDGTPISAEEWMVKFSLHGEFDGPYKRVANDLIGDKYTVSTIWLGLNHQYGDGPPLIFETMVFPVGSYSELDAERYSTLEAAKEGHARMVAKWSAK